MRFKDIEFINFCLNKVKEQNQFTVTFRIKELVKKLDIQDKFELQNIIDEAMSIKMEMHNFDFWSMKAISSITVLNNEDFNYNEDELDIEDEDDGTIIVSMVETFYDNLNMFLKEEK